jgi:hypothetical protein
MQTIEKTKITRRQFRKLGMDVKSKQFKQWRSGGLLDEIDEDFIKETKAYWKSKVDKKVDPAFYTAFMNITGKKEHRLVPGRMMRYEIMPLFNDYQTAVFYKDKNLYDAVIAPPRSPETLVKNVNGRFFDGSNHDLTREEAVAIIEANNSDMIIKPSRSNNGNGVAKLTVEDGKLLKNDKEITFQELEQEYIENYMFQKAIKQHPIMAAPHPHSVNTFRMVTFRWKGEIHYLLGFARFGSNYDIRDNAGASTGEDGIRVGIQNNGEFYKTAISKHGQVHTHHPTTNFAFAELQPVPNFDDYIEFVKECHKNLLHLDFVSWDIVMGEDGKPIFLEANFAGTLTFYQLASRQPLFGDLTDEVLDYAKEEWKKGDLHLRLMSKDRKRLERLEREKEEEEQEQIRLQLKLKTDELEEQQKETVRLQEKIKKQEDKLKRKQTLLSKKRRELEIMKQKYKRIVTSKSWKLTKPMRLVLDKLKR